MKPDLPMLEATTMPRFSPALAIFTLLMAALPATAQIVPTPPRRPLPPDVVLQGRVALERLDLQIDVDDGVATTQVHEEIRNLQNHTLEAQFVFPIPRGAVVHDASLKVGDTWIEAEVLSADEARQAYRDIVRRAIDPALIEYAGEGLLRTHVFPIPARSTRELQLSLTMTLAEDFGSWAYSFPLRAICGGHQGARNVSVEGRVSSSRAMDRPYSPTHDFDVDLSGDRRSASFSMEVSGSEAGSHDLQLFFPNRGEDLTVTTVSTKPAGEDGYALVRISPGSAFDRATTTSKRIVFVLDTSGSMQGDKIRQAKAAVRYALERMNPEDRFSVITYASTVRPLSERLLRPTRQNVAEVLEQLEALPARGGTNIEGALSEGLAMAVGREGAPTYVLFLTDGVPTVGQKDVGALIDAAAKANDGDARIFTFGVGHDVNTRLLDGIAQEGRALARYVLPGEELEVALSNLYDQIAEPLWTDLRMKLSGAGLYDLAPSELGDLFRGQALSVLARYRKGGRFELELSGRSGGQRQSEETGVRLARRSTRHDYLPRLWAGRRIAALRRELRNGGTDDEIVKEIVDLGTRYGIVTEYTSLLMREPEETMVQALRERRVDAGQLREQLRSLGYLGDQNAQPASGAEAVGRAATEGRLFRAGSASSADRLMKSMPSGVDFVGSERDNVSPGATRVVGQRIFRLQAEGRWEDQLAVGATARLTIRAFSDAWFQLAELRPDLKSALALSSNVRIVIDGEVLEIAEDGVEQLDRAARAWLGGAGG